MALALPVFPHRHNRQRHWQSQWHTKTRMPRRRNNFAGHYWAEPVAHTNNAHATRFLSAQAIEMLDHISNWRDIAQVNIDIE